jgi:phospholipid/cholesterol/gamma-HCH transport system substrate-binding protein
LSIARGAAIGAIAAAAIVVIFTLFGGSGGHQYKLRFQTAGQLVKGDDIQVGGRRIGSVDAISLTKDNQAEVAITVDDAFAPLPVSTKATERLTSLSGVANRYIELTMGPNNGPKIPDGGTIEEDKTTSVVDVDQLFDTLDAPTREGLGRVIRGQAQWYKGKEAEGNLAAYFLNPALSTTSDVFNQISSDQRTLGQAVTATAGAMGAIASRRQDLTNLISNSNSFATAIASQNASFATALEALPKTLRRANDTFVNLDSALVPVQNLVNASTPQTVDLAKFFGLLNPAVTSAVPVFKNLAPITYKPGPNNDLADTFKSTPKLQTLANANEFSAFPSSKRSLGTGTNTLSFARPYTVDLTGWIRELGQVTAFYDANGHYARVSPAFNAYSYDSGTQNLTVMDAQKRLSVYEDLAHGTYNTRRCPGAAAGAPAGMTWPFLTPAGCDPSQVLP